MKFNFKKMGNWLILPALLVGLLAGTQNSVHAAGITIDGNFTDWAGKDTFTDSGGADDANPADVDITEYRADADTSGIYLLMAWDDTSFNNASYVAVKVRNYSGVYYQITAAANSGTPPVAASTLSVYQCADSTCGTSTLVCNDVSGTGPCTGAALASGATWTDPFTHTGNCTGANCNTLDTAVEIFVPWALLGGAPTNNQMFFMQYFSYKNANMNKSEDNVAGANGITCTLTGGVYDCYPSDPTAIDLVSFSAEPNGSATGRWPVGIGLLALAALMGLAFIKKRG